MPAIRHYLKSVGESFCDDKKYSGIQGVNPVLDLQPTFVNISANSIENDIIQILKKYNVKGDFQQHIKDAEPSQTKTFTLDEVIKIIDTVESREFEQDWGISFQDTTVYKDTWIRKKELINKFKNGTT